MLVRLISLLIAVFLMSMTTGPVQQDQIPLILPVDIKPNMMHEGTWVHHGRRNIMSAGTDERITFRLMRVSDKMFENDRTFSGWSVTYTNVEYLRNSPMKDPQITTTGPFPVEVDKVLPILTIQNQDPHKSKYTFAYSKDGLILTMPAFVEVEPGQFLYLNQGKHFKLNCENDPRKIPVGKVSMSGLTTGQLYYSYEEMPRFLDGTNDKSARYLRIMERIKESGHLIERARLIWDDYGSPRYEQIPSTGQPRSRKQQIKTWYAKQEGR